MSYVYDYPRPAVTVDCVLYAAGHVLLIERGREPFKGCWALPGGFMDIGETAETAVKREVKEETGIDIENGLGHPFQPRVFDSIDRDPRGRTISLAFLRIFDRIVAPKPGDDAVKAEWFSLGNLPPLAFDHKNIIDRFFSIG